MAMTRIGFGLAGLCAIGLLLGAASQVCAQQRPVPVPNLPPPPPPPSPGANPITPPPAPSPPATITGPGNPAAPSGETANPTTEPIPPPQQNATEGPPPIHHGNLQLERRRPTDGYVTPWSGPHVIEQTIGQKQFLLEGYWVTAVTLCPHWVAGDRAIFVERLPGDCRIDNRSRHRSCPVLCDTHPGWHKPL
jgi:hypothetical protein